MKRQSITFPDEVYQAVMSEAARNDRSFQRTVIQLIRDSLSTKMVQSEPKWFKVVQGGVVDTWKSLFPEVSLSDVMLDRYREITEGDDAWVVDAIKRANAKMNPGRRDRAPGYVHQILVNDREKKMNQSGSKRTTLNQSEPPSTSGDDAVRKRQEEAEALARSLGWGEE